MQETAMYPITEVRQRLKDVLDEVTAKPVMLIKHSRPVAVIVSAERYEQLLNRIEDLEDTVAILRHKMNPRDTVRWETVKAELGLDKPAPSKRSRRTKR